MNKILMLVLLVLTGNRWFIPTANAAPAIVGVTAPVRIGKYEKFEITFEIRNSAARNFQLPFDPDPPGGVDPRQELHRGISVDAEFTPDNWKTVYRQPGFYYHYYQESRDSAAHEWRYPTGRAAWKVRFSANRTGTWHYRIRATDAGGAGVSGMYSLTVQASSRKGFLKVSKRDPRYFEFDDGSLFLGPGINAGGSVTDPIKHLETDFSELQKNRIQLVRRWISGLYGAAWPQWLGGRGIYDGYLPRTGILPFHDPEQNRDRMTLYLKYPEDWHDACIVRDWNTREAVKPDTAYKLSIRYWGTNIKGPRKAGRNYGLVGKITAAWDPKCYEPSDGAVLTGYGRDSSGLNVIEGIWHSRNRSFLPHVYVALENVTQGEAYIHSISMRELFQDGRSGQEILRESSMEYDLVIPDFEPYALDRYLELAEKHDIYLKLVLMDKNDPLYYKLEDDGTFAINGERDNPDGFYGLGRAMNRTRWLQQAWWRYAQARWGYSPNIHSWELTNEGDPFSKKHWEMADELGKFMHCGVFGVPTGRGDAEHCTFEHPNRHMVTTSFWHSFPAYSARTGEGFWGNPKYPNVDYADVHAYTSTSTAPVADKLLMEKDAAYYHLWHSRQYGTWNLHMPVVRGEAGMVPHAGTSEAISGLGLHRDLPGIWFHNYVWSTLGSGGLYEIYWYADPHIYSKGLYDHRPVVLSFHNFVADIALNNGRYRDLEAETSNPDIRVVGQKDQTSGSAHLWIQNKSHTWKNVVDGMPIPSVSGTLRIGGFSPKQTFILERWDTFKTTGQLVGIEECRSSANGFLEIPVASLRTDLAIKVKPAAGGNGSRPGH